MTPDQLNLIENISGIGAIFALVFFTIKWCVKPFIPLMLDFFRGKLTEKSIEKNLMECFEGNHFSDFEKRIGKLENDCNGIREDVRFIKNSHDEIQRELLKIQIKLSI